MAREFGGTIHNRFFDSNHGGLTHGVPRDCKEIAVRCEHNVFFFHDTLMGVSVVVPIIPGIQCFSGVEVCSILFHHHVACCQHHLEDGGLYVDLLAEHQHVAWPAGLVFWGAQSAQMGQPQNDRQNDRQPNFKAKLRHSPGSG